MTTLAVLVASCLGLLLTGHASGGLTLTAVPNDVIPGVTPSLTVTCGPGSRSSAYRRVLLVQLSDRERPLAVLVSGKPPALSRPDDPHVTVSGHLGPDTPPADVSLKVHVSPTWNVVAGWMTCRVVGLGKDGNEVEETQVLNITIHPEADHVNAGLKSIVVDLRRQVESLQQQTAAKERENQRMADDAQATRQALAQRKDDLRRLKKELRSLSQTVVAKETEVEKKAEQLVKQIEQISQRAPATRVAFRAAESIERVYASGNQILLETDDLNEGGNYVRTSSVFRPSRAGLYYFTASQLVRDLTSAAYRVYTIKRGTTVVGGAYSADDRQSSTFRHSSMATLITLGVSSTDWVRVYQEYSSSANSILSAYSNTTDGISTSFAGYLVC